METTAVQCARLGLRPKFRRFFFLLLFASIVFCVFVLLSGEFETTLTRVDPSLALRGMTLAGAGAAALAVGAAPPPRRPLSPLQNFSSPQTTTTLTQAPPKLLSPSGLPKASFASRYPSEILPSWSVFMNPVVTLPKSKSTKILRVSCGALWLCTTRNTNSTTRLSRLF